MNFDNSFFDGLPADPVAENTRRQVERACYSAVAPTPVAAPRLFALSEEVAELIGLEERDPQRLAEVFSGNRRLPGMQTYAACYGGHQFGNWAGQLGDGRAISLGEVRHEGLRSELQLKGAGPTPYSRSADGRAVMRSSVREFLCSEAMHHLGVPTTRALSLVGTGEQVVRDMFYDGNAAPEPGAIVCRVAPSFIRFGSFEVHTWRRDHATLKALADYTITTHFPHLGAPGPEVYAAWVAEVSERTAKMIVEWMRVGFVHGVMNTDNMSVLGLTIDYGPYGWLEPFEPGWTPNTTDAQGRRYRFGNQPQIALWNLLRFANAIYPLVGEAPPLEAAIQRYPSVLEAEQTAMMHAKLGLETQREGDGALVGDLFTLLQAVETDMTLFFRGLAKVEGPTHLEPLSAAWYAEPEAGLRAQTSAWLTRYCARVEQEGRPEALRAEGMNAVNPKYVMRNYLAQVAIDAAEQGDPSEVLRLLDVMRRPYDEQPEREAYAGRRPEWARHRPGCSMLSCSS